MMLTASVRKKTAMCNQILQLNAEILSPLNIDHIFYAVIKPLEDTITLASAPREQVLSAITHTTAHNRFRQSTAHLPPPSASTAGEEPLFC